MNIANRWFRLMAPRRCDLTGVPFGFLLILFPQEGQRWWDPVRGRSIGTWFARSDLNVGNSGCLNMLTQKDCKHDWREWPEEYRTTAETAMVKFGQGRRVVASVSRCDRRVDLSGSPNQLYLETEFEPA